MDYQKMSEELKNNFLNNMPIKVHVIDNGRMKVKEISPDSYDYSDMYVRESQYLRDKINGSSVDSIMSEVSVKLSDEFDDELNSIMDEIHGNEESVTGASAGDGNNSDISVDDKKDADEQIDSEPTVDVKDASYLKNLFKEASLNHKIILNTMFFKYGIDNIWREILTGLDEKSISSYEFKKFVDDLTNMYDKSEIDSLGLFGDEYKKIISKYPVEEELFVKISSIINYVNNGFKSTVTSLIKKYGIDNIWIDIADSLKFGKLDKSGLDEFIHNLKGMYTKDECEKLGIFTSPYFKEVVKDNALYKASSDSLDILDKDEIDHKAIPSRAKEGGLSAKSGSSSLGSSGPSIVSKVLSRRKSSDSLKDKFIKGVSGVREWWGGLSPKHKCIIVGATIAVVGVGIIALSAPMIKDFLENAAGPLNNPVPKAPNLTSTTNTNPTFLDDIATRLGQTFDGTINSVKEVSDTISGIQASGVDFSVIGEGQIGYKTAADAFNGVNGVTLNSYFGQKPSSGIIDVYNMITGWMHLTKEQLNDPEFIKTLAQDSNNVIHINDAWFNLSDIVSLIIKGGKVL